MVTASLVEITDGLRVVTRSLEQLVSHLAGPAQADQPAPDVPAPVAPPPASQPGDPQPDAQRLLDTARLLYAARQARRTHFGADLFGEPAWDMMLDLYIAHCQGKETSTTSLCIASGVPTSTALRYIALLEDSGMVRRQPASHDHRVNYVALSPEGWRKLNDYIAGMWLNATARNKANQVFAGA